MSFKRIGDYIQLVDNRNSDSKISAIGINITKNFMPSVANANHVVIITDYQKGQFAFLECRQLEMKPLGWHSILMTNLQ